MECTIWNWILAWENKISVKDIVGPINGICAWDMYWVIDNVLGNLKYQISFNHVAVITRNRKEYPFLSQHSEVFRYLLACDISKSLSKESEKKNHTHILEKKENDKVNGSYCKQVVMLCKGRTRVPYIIFRHLF